MSKTHTTKALPLRFEAIAEARMKFVPMERGLFADRIEVDDFLMLYEEDIYGRGLTGRSIQCRITHVISQLEMPQLAEDYVAVSLDVMKVILMIDTPGGPLINRHKEGEDDGA